MKKSLNLLIFKPISTGANYIMENETIKSLFSFFLCAMAYKSTITDACWWKC